MEKSGVLSKNHPGFVFAVAIVVVFSHIIIINILYFLHCCIALLQVEHKARRQECDASPVKCTNDQNISKVYTYIECSVFIYG